MGLFEIILIAIGLSMDAFAVALSKGLVINKSYYNSFIIGIYFGLFQCLMPIIGYLLGFSFSSFVYKIDHYIAFTLLSIIGISMIIESSYNEVMDSKLNFSTMILLSIATSIDALAIGVTFSFLNVNIISSSLLIGIITFIISTIGVLIGNKFGNKLRGKSNIIGGIVLIFTGLKILFEHLNVL